MPMLQQPLPPRPAKSPAKLYFSGGTLHRFWTSSPSESRLALSTELLAGFNGPVPATQERVDASTPARMIVCFLLTACVRKDPALFHSCEPMQDADVSRFVVSSCRRAHCAAPSRCFATKLIYSRYQEIATVAAPGFHPQTRRPRPARWATAHD